MGSKLTDLPDLAPSGDFALNSFLIEINDELTDDDLQKLKFLCKGKYGIGKARLEKIIKPMELFDILRERDLLNEMNIITLQAMLWALPRRDLQNKYVEFAESLGTSIHFVVPKDTPENGFKYLKFHIRGTDLETYDKMQLENLRAKIGFLLRVPPEFVIISGIEPSNSLVITVMILDDDCQRLCNISPDDLAILSSAYVNGIMVDETFIPISEDVAKSNPDSPTKSRMEEEARLALLRHTQAEKELSKAHDKIARLESELTAEKKDSQSRFLYISLLVFLVQQCHDVYSSVMKIKRVVEDSASNPVDKLQKMCVFQIFRHSLRKVREAGYNEDLIYNLLDAHALVFQWHRHESKDIIIADLKMKLAFTTWQKEKLAYYHRLGERDRIMSQSDEFFLSALLQNIPIEIEQNVKINTQVSKECVEYALRQLSHDLSESELRKLSTRTRSPGKRKPFTAVSLSEYLMTSINQQQGVELRTFVMRNLATPLNRMELLQNLDRYILEFHTTQNKPQTNKSCGSKSAKRKNRSTFRRGKQMPSHSTPATSTSSDPQFQNFEEINERLSKIEKILERRESNPYPSMTKNSLMDEYESSLKQMFPTSFLGGKYNNLNIP